MEYSSRLKTNNTSAVIIVTILEEDRHMTGNYDIHTAPEITPKILSQSQMHLEAGVLVLSITTQDLKLHITKRQFSSINSNKYSPTTLTVLI